MDYINNWFSQYQPHSHEVFNIFIAIGMIFALLNTFLGFKLTKLWSTLIGIAVGFIFGFIAGAMIWHNDGVALICAIVLAVVLGALAFFIYKAGVFLMCGIAVLSVVFLLLDACSLNPAVSLSVSCIAGVIAGVLSVLFMRPFIIITTALGGGFSFAHSLFELLPAELSSNNLVFGLSLTVLLTGAVIAVLGIIVQFATTKKHVKSKD